MSEEEEAPPQPVWEGKFNEDGLPEGLGVMKYPPPPLKDEEEEEKPGDVFEGTMVAGKREGKGTYKWSNGAVFEGSYKDNKKQGKGKLIYPDKSVYEGDFVDDAMHGTGSYTYANGDLYMGSFANGKRSGQGMYHYKAASTQLIGEWSDGKFLRGRWVYKDGSMFYGEFKDGVSPSQGAYFFSSTSLVQRGSHANGTWDGEAPFAGKAPGAAELESQGAAIPKEQSMPQSWVKDVRPKSAGSNSTPSTPTIPSSRPAFLFSKSSTSTRSSQKLRHSRGKVGSNGLNSGDVPCSPIDVTVPDGAFAFGGITSRKAEQPLLVETQEENGVEITLST